MAIGDVAAKVVVIHKHDTSDAKAKLKELSGIERKQHEDRLKQTNEHNARLEKISKTIGNYAVALGALGVAFGVMGKAASAATEHARLSTAALGVDIEKLGTAALGTRTNLQLLSDAAKMNHGVFKLTTAEMATAQAAMVGLTDRGFEAAKAHDAVLKAVVELDTNALKPFGVTVKKGANDLETLTNTLDALKKLAPTVASGQQHINDELRRSVIEARNWADELERAFGAAINIEQLARYSMGRPRPNIRPGQSIIDWAQGEVLDPSQPKIDRAVAEAQRVAQEAAVYAQRYPKVTLGEAEVTDAPAAKATGAAIRKLAREIMFNEARNVGGGLGAGGLGAMGAYNDNISSSDLTAAANVASTRSWNDRLAASRSGTQNRLESMFGKVEDYSTYTAAFQALESSMASSFDAVISGSMGAGEAFKKFLGSTLKSLAVSEAVQATKELAWGFGELAWGAAPKALLHFKSAALHGATAVAAGAGASLLGGSGGGGGGGGGYSASPGGGVSTGGGSSGASQPQGSHVVYVIGDDFSDNTPRQRARGLKRQMAQAVGSGGVLYK